LLLYSAILDDGSVFSFVLHVAKEEFTTFVRILALPYHPLQKKWKPSFTSFVKFPCVWNCYEWQHLTNY
jgi:hypothetical protein